MECQNDSKKVCKSFLQSIKIFKNQDSIITSLKRRVHLTFLRRKNLWCFKIVWCSISIVFWVWGLATLALEMDAENPSSLVFHAPKKRWQVYYLASRAARIIIIVQLGTEKNEPPRVQFSCGSIPTYSWVGPKIDWRHSGWIFTVGVLAKVFPKAKETHICHWPDSNCWPPIFWLSLSL